MLLNIRLIAGLFFCWMHGKKRKTAIIFFLFPFWGLSHLFAQIGTTGCLSHNFGIDAGLYSNTIEYGSATPASGSADWFFSAGVGGIGYGVIDESNPLILKALLQSPGNPTYVRHMKGNINSLESNHLMIDAVWARDNFGGTGGTDLTSFNTASKNGEDPAIWDPGPQNVLGKNDLIDVGGFMYRDGVTLDDNLWFVGLINRAEPGGDAYMDFEFFVENVTYTPGAGFSSGGAQLGHTAFNFDSSGNITKVGDFIFNVSLTGGGTNPGIEVRLWVSYADYTSGHHPPGFTWGPNYDGAFTGSPYGYASIIPATPEICGIVNTSGQNPLAPPWGTKGTKANTWGTNYIDYSVAELGINMSHFGLDHSTLLGVDKCIFPTHTFIVKTRSSNSFTAQLKDFAGPFGWGQASMNTKIIGTNPITCNNPTVSLSADPIRTDATYLWTTVDGAIDTDPAQPTVTVSNIGTYTLHTILSTTGCSVPDVSILVSVDPLKPLFTGISATSTVSCSGSDGTIHLTVEGGTPPLSYSWLNASNTQVSTVQNPTGLAAGTYSVTVTDNIGCTKALAGVVVEAGSPPVISLVQTPTTCYGSSNGSISATVSGNSPFTYLWSTGATTKDITNLSAGSYTLTATDAKGCTQSSTIAVTQPAPVSLSVVKVSDTDPSAAGNGTITLTISGGTPTYGYAWTKANSGFTASTKDLANLTAGIYSVLVTDANGCTATISTTIYEPEICNDGIDNDGNGLIDCTDGTCIPLPPGTITASQNPVCVGATGVTYTVPNTAGYTYAWTVPGGAEITGGQGTNQIIVSWISNISGQICVRQTTTMGCVSSTSSCFTVILQTLPAQPGTITKTP